MRDVLFCVLQFGICLAVNLLYIEKENGASKSIVRNDSHNFFVYVHSNNFYKEVDTEPGLNFFFGKNTQIMKIEFLIVGILSVLVIIYLVYAIWHPEEF